MGLSYLSKQRASPPDAIQAKILPLKRKIANFLTAIAHLRRIVPSIDLDGADATAVDGADAAQDPEHRFWFYERRVEDSKDPVAVKTIVNALIDTLPKQLVCRFNVLMKKALTAAQELMDSILSSQHTQRIQPSVPALAGSGLFSAALRKGKMAAAQASTQSQEETSLPAPACAGS